MSYTAIDRNQVSFYLFPVNNNRTAWRPVGLPVIMVVPRRRTATGIPIENSQVDNVYIYIENVSKFAYVVGEDHILKDGTQLRYPSKELYRQNLTPYELIERLLIFEDLTFIDPSGKTKPYAEAGYGDFIKYTTSSEVTDVMPYYPDADYYDLSDILIDVEILPTGYYNLVYSADFYFRNIDTSDSSFVCVSQQEPIAATFRFGIDHPGQVMAEMYRHTPPPYLTDAKKSADTTVAFYRPFSDIINDVFDEQKLLETINWVNETPSEIIPYLAYLLGWDLPYFPQTKGTKSLDSLRRAIIRTTVYFQNLRGSEKAIRELFNIFGIEAHIERLWYSSDGAILIRPNEKLEDNYKADQITGTTIGQIDLVVDRFLPETASSKIIDPATNNLIVARLDVDTHLLYTPTDYTQINNTNVIANTNDFTLEAYTVTQGSPADNYLSTISSDIRKAPGTYGADRLIGSPNTILYSDIDAYNYEGVISHSLVHVSGSLGTVKDSQHEPDTSIAPLNDFVKYDVLNNKVTFTYNGYVQPGQAVYVFAYYRRVEITVPIQLQENISNYFNLILVTKDNQQQIDPKTLSFAVDFLKKIKPFHSIINAYRTSAELTETYEVTDLSIGGDTSQRAGTGIGMLQVPPAIIPSAICGDPIAVGYKPTDIALRLKKLENLTEEQFVQYILNGDDKDFGARISPNKKDDASIAGPYWQYGQTVIANGRVENQEQVLHPSANANSQAYGVQNNPPGAEHDTINSEIKVVSTNRDSGSFGSFTKEYRGRPTQVAYPLDGYTDYAYKGRVEDEILYRGSSENDETPVLKTGPISMGSGVYWAYPRVSISIRPNTASGNSPKIGLEYYKTGDNSRYFEKRENSYYGRLIDAYKTTSSQTLHFTNREAQYYPDQLKDQAYQRHSLNIEKAIMHLPGCRFATMNKLYDDYVNPAIDARPWDDYYATVCGPINACNHPNIPLNYRLVDGNSQLVFDSASYISAGNKQYPDIINLGDNQTLEPAESFSVSDIIHTIYSSSSDSLYVTLDQIDLTLENDQYPVQEPIFSTAHNCGTEIHDIIDGYKSVYGGFSVSATYCSDFDNAYASFSDPSINSFLYKLSSGIRIETGLRLDAGTNVVVCGSMPENIISSIDFYMRNGQYDFSPDMVDMTSNVSLEEPVTIGVLYCDGILDNMLELTA